jgi:uncharacterized protein (DUF2147 family)
LIELAICNGRLWGVVSWEKEHGTDRYNPDPAKRQRPTLGIPILLGLEQTDATHWRGRIYNPEDGKTYHATVTQQQQNVINVEGCVLGGWICSSEDWTRASASTGSVGSSPASDVCSRLSNGTGLPHQGGLK